MKTQRRLFAIKFNQSNFSKITHVRINGRRFYLPQNNAMLPHSLHIKLNGIQSRYEKYYDYIRTVVAQSEEPKAAKKKKYNKIIVDDCC